ncbi:MAG TPA: sensor histidine kinase [Firmicutes bacterium]|jgi:two-component system, sensor histidine kinase YesM|nr:sensor histidine kinase [Bacillota bacterium]
MEQIIRFLRKFQIKNRIAFFLLLGLLITSNCVFIGSKLVAQALIKQYLYNYVELTQRETVSSLEMIIDEINMLTVRLMEDRSIYRLFDDRQIAYSEREQRLKGELDRLLVHKDVVGGIFIYGYSGEIYKYTTAASAIPLPEEHFIRQIEQSKIPVWGPVVKDPDNNSYILVGRKFRNFVTGETIGYLIIDVRESALYNIYRRIIPNWGYSFILANDEYIISHPDKNKIGSIIFDSAIFDSHTTFDYKTIKYNQKWSIIAIYQLTSRLEFLGIRWKIISVVSEKKLFGIISAINSIVLNIEIIISIIAVFLALYISFNITRPLAKLKNKLDLIGKGKPSLLFSENANDEIEALEQSFNNMVLRIEELIQKNNLEKEKQRELELTALQAQINPHFVYNTLDAIAWIAKLKKQSDIERMVMALATFFRISLHKGEKFITLAEEIQLVESFVIIEQLRFPDKVEITYDIPEDIKSCLILKIILQPLVENAIKHGISTKEGKGHIQITGCRVGNDLKLEVSDDGVGFNLDAGDIESSNKNMQQSGYGLRNVDERIKLEYGPGYGLFFKSEKNKGTIVTITVKVREIDK